MDEKMEWQDSIDRADSPQLKITRLRTRLAMLRSDRDRGGPSHAAEIEDVRQQLRELAK